MNIITVQTNTKTQPGLGRRIVDIFLALLIYFVCVSFLFFVTKPVFVSVIPESLSQRITDLIGLGIATFFLLKRYPLEEENIILNIFQGKLWLKYGLLPGLLVAILSYPYSYIHKSGTITPESFVSPQQNFFLLFAFLLLAIFVSPIVEEYFARACVFRILKSKMGFFPATLVSTCIFVLLHNISGHAQFMRLFIISLVLTISYEFSNKIASSIIAHIIGNGIWYIAVYGHIYSII